MKNISRNKKIAVKAGTLDGELYKAILETEPGVKKMLIEPGLTAYLSSDGTTIEIYSSGFCCPDYLFAHSNIVVSFQVTSISQTLTSLIEKGAVLLGEVHTVCSSHSYCHLLTPEKTVIGVYELNY
ncbi:hypothetical protein SAMN06265348_102464 [Pedobacter westerhofensis]|uniref:Uncharacterized protein n=1 Tax=Pedobacter westerhofensis TaxID=425512 RepID=A0A521BNZ8_9SPHI|nr:hypothetical protein [Pedobacter westerhofensis]SMO48878.1 hypothetical protein SAMN06265348_102464 [Pedobacter westerhofensis]